MLALKVWLLSRFLLNETPFLKPLLRQLTQLTFPEKGFHTLLNLLFVCVLAPACFKSYTFPSLGPLSSGSSSYHSDLSKETNGDQISFPPLADRAHLAQGGRLRLDSLVY